MTKFTLRAIDIDGNEFFYTGKAGQEWVSPKLSEAFAGYSKEGAERKAALFNRMTGIHGLRFIRLQMPERV